MLKIRWRIGRKPKGNYRTPLELNIIYENSEELKLRPHLVFQQEYPLPGTIYLGSEKVIKEGEDACRVVNRIKISIDAFVDQPKTLHHKFLLDPNICSSTCQFCRAYLEWRPGRADYSDFEAVFQKVALDLCGAWREAVENAENSEELEKDEVVFTADATMPAENTVEGVKKLSRKLRLSC